MESTDINYCPNCGEALDQDVNFCPSCGQSLQEVTENIPSPQNSVPTAQLPQFKYAIGKQHSEIITTDDTNGEPVVKFRNLHPNATWLFFFQFMGKTAILLLLFFITAIFDPLLAILFIILYFVVLYVAARINYTNFEFEVSPVAFRKAYGVFHKYTVNIAFDQIQNINMRRSILDQMLGLAHLEIETAGTGGEVKKNVSGLITTSEGYIPGITPEEAADVQALMFARIHIK
jgi:membrane protein YdbS with pleckstrin-like domain